MYTEKIICNQYTEGILTVLNYNNRPVRKFYINGEIWLALSDICSVLNLTNPSSVASGMDSNEKMTISLASSHSGQRGGAQKLILVNIWGLIHWLNSSHKPEAKAFQRWVKTEVTPSTLKYGGYILGQNSMDAVELENAAGIVAQNILADRERQLQELQLMSAEQAALIREYEPKARYYDAVLRTQDVIPIRVIAKNYGLSAQKMNSYLHERGVQYRWGDTWLLYQPYADKGYTHTQTIFDGSPYSKLHTCWTQRGRAFLYDFLRADGILPLSERMNVSEDIEDIGSL